MYLLYKLLQKFRVAMIEHIDLGSNIQEPKVSTIINDVDEGSKVMEEQEVEKAKPEVETEDKKDEKCNTCGIFTCNFLEETHQYSSSCRGAKDHNCDSCGISFFRADHLKAHINSVNEGHKDYKYE